MILARRVLLLCAFVGLLVGGWYFAARNSASVTVHHPGGEIGEMRLWLALLLAFGSGVAIAAAAALVRGTRMRMVARRYRKLVESLQAEIHQLRNLPLASDASLDAGGLGDGQPDPPPAGTPGQGP